MPPIRRRESEEFVNEKYNDPKAGKLKGKIALTANCSKGEYIKIKYLKFYG